MQTEFMVRPMSRLHIVLGHWLAALMLFAALAPAISKALYACESNGLPGQHAHQMHKMHVAAHAPDHHQDQREFPIHHSHGTHCSFCIAAIHLPFLPTVNTNFFKPAPIPVALAYHLSLRSPPRDSVQCWLQLCKHGPPALI